MPSNGSMVSIKHACSDWYPPKKKKVTRPNASRLSPTSSAKIRTIEGHRKKEFSLFQEFVYPHLYMG